ncbi:hypothetical protein [Bradyrhizobium sp. STM 3809]|uniref:hypothetical protein n=1 Tax=Bradyrhizobium sp. STM 3809 TaxID=551936 RepID=UPI0005566608|nr:hypothetical protein [Bradyrhizobium sp. STM 3809]
MSTPTSDELLYIGDQILLELPLDRTIQHIQQYRKVYSTRLHPLLCALTSAQTVAYAEQPLDDVNSLASGKFRSLLVDIFGRTYPEEQLFEFDRDAVVKYKQRVRRNMTKARSQISDILSNVKTAAM